MKEKSTRCVHAGTIKDAATKGINTPIYTSTAYAYIDQRQQFYPRYFNVPNQQAVVEKLCALEGAAAGLVFSSGMAAITTVLLAHLQFKLDFRKGTICLLSVLCLATISRSQDIQPLLKNIVNIGDSAKIKAVLAREAEREQAYTKLDPKPVGDLIADDYVPPVREGGCCFTDKQAAIASRN